MSVARKRRHVLEGARDLLGVPPGEWPATIGQDRGGEAELDQYSLAYLADLYWEPAGELAGGDQDTQFLGYSREVAMIRSRIGRLASTPAPVLVVGDRGTGKGQLVRAMCARMGTTPLVVPLASVSKELGDAELFGHVKGAFTGAGNERAGILLTAHRDQRLLYLDDVSECSPAVQAKLLTALDDGTIRPVGSDDIVPLGRGPKRGFRLVSSSQRSSLHKLRPDLLDRLSTIQVWIPPLRKRGLDILLLADRFVELGFGKRGGNNTLSRAAHRLLLNYSWPGNVRQLMSVVSRAGFEVGHRGRIGASTLAACLDAEQRLADAAGRGDAPGVDSGNGTGPDLPDRPLRADNGPACFPTMAEVRDLHFRRALDQAHGSVTRAATLLNVHRSTLQRWRARQRNGCAAAN